MNLLVVSGSRADFGLLEWPVKLLEADPYFDVLTLDLWGDDTPQAMRRTEQFLPTVDMVLVLGDRYEILGAVLAAHLARVPVAHIGGGDVTEGSYDDAMRDCISRMASIHFVTSTSAMARLTHMGLRNVHLVGNPGIDYIRNAPWMAERPIAEPYVVVSYQAETIDGTNEIQAVIDSLPTCHQVFIMPNADKGSAAIRERIIAHQCARRLEAENCIPAPTVTIHEYLPHDQFLNLIFHCEEFIGNSSAMLYEAPELGVKTRMIGKRQRGRTIPWGDGHASERIVKILKYSAL